MLNALASFSECKDFLFFVDLGWMDSCRVHLDGLL